MKERVIVSEFNCNEAQNCSTLWVIPCAIEDDDMPDCINDIPGVICFGKHLEGPTHEAVYEGITKIITLTGGKYRLCNTADD